MSAHSSPEVEIDVTAIDDIDVFRARVSTALSPFGLHKSNSDRFTSSIWGTALGDVGVLQFSTGGPLGVQIPQHLDYFDFVIGRRGSATVWSGASEVQVETGARGVVLRPGSEVQMTLNGGYDQVHLRVSSAQLLHAAEQLTGGEVGSQIAFNDPVIELVSSRSVWASALLGLVDDAHRGLGAPHPLVAHQWADTMVASILTSMPNTLTPVLNGSPARVPYRSVSRAIEFIDARLPDALVVADVAAAAGVSVRSLQRAFQEYFGLSPMRLIEEKRLTAVHRDLADPAKDVTVSEVAYRWGFSHLPRFAALYARRYGELPSQTLRLTRAR